MPQDTAQNQIFHFFTPSQEQHREFNYSEFTSSDSYKVFAVCSLTSQHLKDLNTYMALGLTELTEQFDLVNLPILDRMKEVIYAAGDKLADQLMNSKEPVEDVDFSVGLLAFKDDVLYVWIDGQINVRLYRGKDSLVVNTVNSPQFFGSTELRLGDIICASFNENILQADPNFEEYILEEKRPSYPALYIDYQTENVIEKNTELVKEPTYTNALEPDSDPEIKRSASFAQYTESESDAEISLHTSKEGVISNSFKPKKSSDNVKIIKAKIGPFFNSVHQFLLKITSSVVDLFYTKVLRKNQHQLKRFKDSKQKRNLQYLILFLIAALVLYLLVFKGFSDPKTTTNSTPAVAARSDAATKTSIQTEFETLVQSYNNADVANFETHIETLRSAVNKAKNNGFSDTSYLDDILSQSSTYEDTLYKVTPITKVDGVFSADATQNASIIDFDTVGSDVYALDQTNSRVLKSNAEGQLEVFASSADLSKMFKISCTEGNCYVLDEDAGLAVLNFSTKKFSTFKGLSTASTDVKDMVYAFDSIYTLAPAQGKVLKYAKAGEGFKAAVQWNTTAGFNTETQDFAIDGNVFELNSSGELKKYFSGKYDPSFKGLGEAIPALGKNLNMAITPARQNGRNRLYISDADNKRVAVYEKDIVDGKYAFKGSYKYKGTDQIKFDRFEEVTLSKDEKFLFILENNLIYKISVTGI
jgi:hypothetical protein